MTTGVETLHDSTGDRRRRAPALLILVAALAFGAIGVAAAIGWRTNAPLPDSMVGVRAVPGTGFVIELAGLGMIAVDPPPKLDATPRPQSLNSPDGALHVELASPEALVAGNPGSIELEQPVGAAVARADVDGVGEFGVSVEFVEELTDRDPPVRFYVAYSRALRVACLMQIKGDTDPLALANRMFRAVRPARQGESTGA